MKKHEIYTVGYPRKKYIGTYKIEGAFIHIKVDKMYIFENKGDEKEIDLQWTQSDRFEKEFTIPSTDIDMIVNHKEE